MVFIGDLYQLPPVLTSYERDAFMERYKTPYFFGSYVFTDGAFEMEFIEFEKIYRQKDDTFIHLLNRIRNNSPEDADLDFLNRRCVPPDRSEGMIITLATTNATAESVNKTRLMELAGKSRIFSGNILGTVDQKQLPTETDLILKLGAQIMFVANDTRGRWVNGTIGKISGFRKDDDGDDIIEVLTEG